MSNRLLIAMMLSAFSACKPDDFDGDGIPAEEDCNDLSANGPEVCDGIDNDCNGEVDDNASDLRTFFVDADGDRFGLESGTVTACALPAGYAEAAGDCDDADPAVFEGQVEICNDKDDNCDGAVDEGAAAKATYYRDADGDRWGDGSQKRDACTPPSGYVTVAEDCDDSNAESHPGAIEVCDGQDNDCDKESDENAVDRGAWWVDGDGDGYGAGPSTLSCDAPDGGWVAVDGDCDDRAKASYPGGRETCDLADNNCNGLVDDNATDARTWYRDADGDKFGAADMTAKSCASPAGYVEDATDCDDVDVAAYPGGTEYCDEVDNDCDKVVDEDATDPEVFYADADADGAGDAKVSVTACEPPTGYVTNALDCDDKDKAIIHCVWAGTRNFTSCGQTGKSGPSSSQCSAAYKGTNLELEVSVTSGVQSWTVPANGTYQITAYGAQGGGSKGGAGAWVQGDFVLTKGTVLNLVVGQRGGVTSQGAAYCAGGGGGSFVYTSASSTTPMLAAAGGGGQAEAGGSAGCGVATSGGGGSSTTTPTLGTGTGSASGGSGGTGGLGGLNTGSYSTGGGGAGWTANGSNGTYLRNPEGKGGFAVRNGAVGGTFTHSSGFTGADGGFGGGGSGSDNTGAGGGGGGYNGGGGGNNYAGSCAWGSGGGAGSYNGGSSTSGSSSAWTGEGKVVIAKK